MRSLIQMIFGQSQAIARFKKIFLRTRKKLFLECLKEYFSHVEKQSDLSPETMRKYWYSYNNIKRYLMTTGEQDIKCNQVKTPVFEGMRAWLHENLKSCGKTHSSRHLEKCIAAMDYAVTRGWAKYNALNSLQTGRDKRKPVVHLTQDELKIWINRNWANEVYRKVQILSIFQAATGLSYGNLFDYKTSYDPENGLWIEDNRKKIGKKPFYVPLDAPEFKIAKAIHEAFDGHLPKMERGQYNKLIKEMAAQLNINKRLTSHCFRKTFATLMDQEGFELGVIAAILGNTEEICRDHYIKPTKKKVEKAFKERNEIHSIRSILNN